MRADQNQRKPDETDTAKIAAKADVAADLNDLAKPLTPADLATNVQSAGSQNSDALIGTKVEEPEFSLGLQCSQRLAWGLEAIDEKMCAEVDAEVERMSAAGERPVPSQFRHDGPDPFGIDFAWAGGKTKK